MVNLSNYKVCSILQTFLQDSQISAKHTVHQPISRKQRLLQELHNTSLPDQQKLSTHISTVDQLSTKPKVGLHTCF